ncbi:DENN domain-containing protein 1A-like isoform X3 [Dreissena polymorpha]|uniref:DENN domain-containing protein 1A-like isoform X3 n=1 Tax=Dreissena polymorpha TaxID=45954 RepID=UPI002264E4B0|nr:DENN domain-containing protein 1A-like isoform X3 [Dreissena polymorpha]
MSRLRENPEKLFEVFIEVGKPTAHKSEPFILQKYPLDFNDEEVLKSVPKFAFPCDTERYTTTVDHFTFTLTDLDSKFRFGFCRHATGAQTCLCIVSFLPWFEVFYNLLNILAEITNRTDDNDVTAMLRAAYVQEVPGSGLPVTIVSGQEMMSFKAPEVNKLPSIPASRNLLEYYNAVDTENMMTIFASMLHERRIIVTSKKLSRLTAVVYASSNLLYPMYWQHLFIPVLPEFLKDYLSAPMPFVIGVHVTLMEKVNKMELGDAVIVDADNNKVTTQYDDLVDLPEEVSHYLKKYLKGEKLSASMQGAGDAISKTFMMSLVKLIGGYRDALKFTEGETITFSPEAFVQSRPLSMQPFLQNMLHLQIFQQFIVDRLDMLNCGAGFADLFEQECLVHADKLNSQTRYNEWLGKMKKQGKKLQKGGKDVWSDFKVKAKPVMKEARGVMDIVTNRVKTQGKKAYSKARTKFNDFKKDDDSPKSGSPKTAKSVRHGPKTKSFSKDKPPDLSRDRPSTIVGKPLVSQRPIRPSTTSPALVGGHSTHMSIPTTFVSHVDGDKCVSPSPDDNDVMVYNRVSCTLMADPDIQNAIYKSASAEHLPGSKLFIKSNDSSDSSSTDGDLDGGGGPDAYSPFKGDNSMYSQLLDDDDSGIVMRTSSQTSLEQSKPDFGKFENNWKPNVTSESQSYGTEEINQRPPLPAPRKSLSGVGSTQVLSSSGTGSTPVSDRLIGRHVAARERPKPLPRRQSVDSKDHGDTSTDDAKVKNLPNNSGDNLITLKATDPVTPKPDLFDLESEFSNLKSSGDYVVLREPKVSRRISTDADKRASVSRSPALKLGQDETPKRPSVRRDRSPVSPMDPLPQTSVLDFDPLLDSQAALPSSQGDATKPILTTDNNSDSLLHDWHIGHLSTNLSSNSPVKTHSRSSPSFPYGQYASRPPRPQPMNAPTIPQFYSPRPNSIPSQQWHLVNAPMGTQTPLPLSQSRPHVPARPVTKPDFTRQMNKSSAAVNQSGAGNQYKDPFADLINITQSTSANQSAKQPQKQNSWETFIE